MRQLKITKQITNRETASLDRYLSEIGKIDLITSEEEAFLAKRIREGDEKALEKMTKANLRFVVSVAKQYQNNGLSLSDLINEGNYGLIKAARRFDETRGFKFISYAVWWIRQAMMQALAEQARVVRLPLNRISSITKILKTTSELQQRFQREPSSEELATALEIKPEDIVSNISISVRHVSLNAPLASGEDVCLLDTLEDPSEEMPDSALLSDSLCSDVKQALATLTARESEIVTLYFGIDQTGASTLEEIGDKFMLTQERVRQIKEQAIRKLKNNYKHKILKAYLA